MKGLITELRDLLGFKHTYELADALGIPLDTINGFNTGRGSKYVLQAYAFLVKALKMLPEADRSTILTEVPRKELTLSQKYIRKADLEKAIESQKPKIQKSLDSASETFFIYNRLLERYKEIKEELKHG